MTLTQRKGYSYNLHCNSRCQWRERWDGSVTCDRCGSGFSAEARRKVEKIYDKSHSRTISLDAVTRTA